MRETGTINAGGVYAKRRLKLGTKAVIIPKCVLFPSLRVLRFLPDSSMPYVTTSLILSDAVPPGAAVSHGLLVPCRLRLQRHHFLVLVPQRIEEKVLRRVGNSVEHRQTHFLGWQRRPASCALSPV